MNEPPCPACDGNGWLFANTGNDQSACYQVQRCDSCEQYQSDQAALEAVVKLARTHFGRGKHDRSKETCIGRLDSAWDARYAVHAANVLPELVAAVKHLQQNWEKNLTEPMARLNQALVQAETIKPMGTPTLQPVT